MYAIINSQDLPEAFSVGTYDGNTYSTNDGLDSAEGSGELDFGAYFSDLVDSVGTALEERLPGFHCLRDTRHNPRFYNYSTDSVDWKIEIPESVFKDAPEVISETAEGKQLEYARASKWQQDAIDAYVRERAKDIEAIEIAEHAPYVGRYIS